MESWPVDDRTRLAWLVEHFDCDAAESRKLIRQMLDASPPAFLRNAIAVLREFPGGRGSQYLVTLLVANDLLVAAVCDPAIPRDQAVTVVRSALRVHSMVDMTLAKALANRDPATTADPVRLMEVLEEISDGNRILSSLLRLLRHENPKIRSKAVLMIGRGGRGVRWVERRLGDNDPRVRANAVESIWGVDSPEARVVLRGAIRDPHHRVAGNAVLGLYLLGDPGMIPEVRKMSSHEDPAWRETALWIMGRTGDPRFSEVVAEQLRESDPMVRKRAFWAVGRIKETAARLAGAPQWRVAARIRPPERGVKTRNIRVALASPEGKPAAGILPTHFLLQEDGHPVDVYQVTEKDPPPAIAVAFVFPRIAGRTVPPWMTGALHALEWKRNSDIWGLALYKPAADGASSPPEQSLEEAVFASTTEAIRANFTRTAIGETCPDLWTAIWNVVRGQKRLTRGEHRVIVFSGVEESRAGGMGLISSVILSQTLVQAVSIGSNPPLEQFCRKTRGAYREVTGESEAAAAVEQAYLQLFARYEIAYPPIVARPRSLLLRVHSPVGHAEITLAVPPGAEPPALDAATGMNKPAC